MAKAKKMLFSALSATAEKRDAHKNQDTAENVLNKRIIEKMIKDIRERLKNPKDAQKASLIIQQWLYESKDQKK